jgi:hypothetical protein
MLRYACTQEQESCKLWKVLIFFRFVSGTCGSAALCTFSLKQREADGESKKKMKTTGLNLGYLCLKCRAGPGSFTRNNVPSQDTRKRLLNFILLKQVKSFREHSASHDHRQQDIHFHHLRLSLARAYFYYYVLHYT